ncbi:MAG: YigZ family protein [Saprospiraceae bacterium]|nr:YigZ family protein [Saprospiraceae bacterium]
MNIEASFYHSIGESAEGIYQEKGSKFIAYAIPCSDENQLKKYIEHFSQQHPKARHICHAWKSGPDLNLNRSSDDGEPSGSAGKPMFQQIESHQLMAVAIICIRYFGGIKLGSSGLSKAYKTAAKLALDQAQPIQIHIMVCYQIESNEENISILYGIIKNLGIQMNETGPRFLKICIPKADHENLIQKIKIRFEKNQYEPSQDRFVLLHCKIQKL